MALISGSYDSEQCRTRQDRLKFIQNVPLVVVVHGACRIWACDSGLKRYGQLAAGGERLAILRVALLLCRSRRESPRCPRDLV
jgi:hypothetical protein